MCYGTKTQSISSTKHTLNFGDIVFHHDSKVTPDNAARTWILVDIRNSSRMKGRRIRICTWQTVEREAAAGWGGGCGGGLDRKASGASSPRGPCTGVDPALGGAGQEGRALERRHHADLAPASTRPSGFARGDAMLQEPKCEGPPKLNPFNQVILYWSTQLKKNNSGSLWDAFWTCPEWHTSLSTTWKYHHIQAYPYIEIFYINRFKWLH